MTQQISPARAFVAARLSPGGVYGLHLTAGLALVLAAAGLFSLIAWHVVSQAPITVLDLELAHYLHRQAADGGWTVLMLALTNAHSTIPLLVLAALFGFYLVGQRAHGWLLTLLVAVPGGMLLNVGLKNIFQRVRPQFDEPLVMLATYSFPSGHANGATLLYGMVAAWCVCRVKNRRARILACCAAAAMVLLVAFSRLYLGAHYLSDVMAGMLGGTTWLTICLTTKATLRRRRLQGLRAAGNQR